MLSVIIPTEGVEQTTVATLAALVPGAAAGIIREVLLVDGTRNGVIERVADVAGCRFIGFDAILARRSARCRRAQARSPWLMFLPAGAVLETGWIEETTQFIQAVSASGRDRAAVFPLWALALRRYRIPPHPPRRGAQARRPPRRSGTFDRARSLRPDRRLSAPGPPRRGTAAAAARPFIPDHAAQPDRHGRVRPPDTCQSQIVD